MGDFETEVTINIVGDSKGFPNGQGGLAIVKWKCEFELGSKSANGEIKFFGIKAMLLSCPDQTITFNSYFYEELTDEESEKEVAIKLEDVKINNDLGDCSLDKFQLLPVELIIYKDNAELSFA